MRRYKDDQLNTYYQRLRRLGSPIALEQAGIFGTILASFRRGFEGAPRGNFVVRKSFAWVAYYAGRDSVQRSRMMPMSGLLYGATTNNPRTAIRKRSQPLET